MSRSAPANPFAMIERVLRPLLVVARNAIPVIGVFAFGWPAAIIIFQLWWDGVTALASSLSLHTLAFLRNDPTFFPAERMVERLFPAGLGLFLVILILGIPYWFLLGLIAARHYDQGLWTTLASDRTLQLFLGAVLLTNLVEGLLRGAHRMSDAEIRAGFDREFQIHLIRIALTIMLSFFFLGNLVLAAAVAFSYVELYPIQAIRVFGDGSTE